MMCIFGIAIFFTYFVKASRFVEKAVRVRRDDGSFRTAIFAEELVDEADGWCFGFEREAEDISSGGVDDDEVGRVSVVGQLYRFCRFRSGIAGGFREIGGASYESKIHVKSCAR